MPWIYFTSISPIDDQYNSFNEAFNLFLGQCIVNKNDKIVCKDGKVFLKSKFLVNKNFKKSLIDYYRPLSIFVKGPREIIRRDGSVMNKWIIELLPMYSC